MTLLHFRVVVNLARHMCCAGNHINWTSCEGDHTPRYQARHHHPIATWITDEFLTVITCQPFPSSRVCYTAWFLAAPFIHNSSFCSDAFWWMTGESWKSESQELRWLNTMQRLTDILQLTDFQGVIINVLHLYFICYD